jgi:histidyl-tRNA synthetase
MRQQNWLFGKWRTVAEKYGFEEYDAACLESESIFRRKKGANKDVTLESDSKEDDLIKEMYCFESGDQVVCLRPELTTSMARMLLSRQSKRTGNIDLRLPLKWFSIPRCWRNETPQKGRKREFFQWNMDIVGVPGVSADAELFAAIIDLFRSIGLSPSDIEIQINSRIVIEEMLSALGVDQDRYSEVIRVVDKRDKFPSRIEAEQELAKIVGGDRARKILDLSYSRNLDEFAQSAELQGSAGVQELRDLFGLLSKSGMADWVKFDASIARGLDYYTGVVFEAFALDTSLEVRRAICGGGRYNRLLSVLGSVKEVPCVGFGMGDCVIFELLASLQRLPSSVEVLRPVTFAVVPFTQKYMGDAMQIAQQLRAAGQTVDVCLDPKVVKKEKANVKAAFDYANQRVGAKYIVFVAPDELEQGMVKVKDLSTEVETQWRVPLEDLEDFDRFVQCNPPLPPAEEQASAMACGVCRGSGKLVEDPCPLCK